MIRPLGAISDPEERARLLADEIRTVAPEIAREDDDDLDVTPERARASELVALALDAELDHNICAAMLAQARDAYHAITSEYSERAGDRLYRRQCAQALVRYERWLDVQQALTDATRAEGIQAARALAERREVSS